MFLIFFVKKKFCFTQSETYFHRANQLPSNCISGFKVNKSTLVKIKYILASF